MTTLRDQILEDYGRFVPKEHFPDGVTLHTCKNFAEFAQCLTRSDLYDGEGFEFDSTILFFMGVFNITKDRRKINIFYHLHKGLPVDELQINQKNTEQEVYHQIINKTAQNSNEWLAVHDWYVLLQKAKDKYEDYMEKSDIPQAHAELIKNLLVVTSQSLNRTTFHYPKNKQSNGV